MKKIIKQIILALCLTLAVAFLLSACGNKEYKVTFNDNYEGAVEADFFVRTVKSGDTTHSRVPDGRTGYTFTGVWYTDPAGTQPFDFSTPIKADIVLYAKWNVNVYNITWNLNYTGAPAATVTTAEHFSKITPLSPVPTRTGYVFSKWRTAASGASAVDYDFDNTVITGARTLYASWTAA